MLAGVSPDLARRAAGHAALGDPVRLAIVDELTRSDRAPVELRTRLGLESNLLAHHLDVLEQVGMIVRSRSSGDGRRRYVHLVRHALHDLAPAPGLPPQHALFVCTRNSARSHLAAALWRSVRDAPAESAGTHPARQVHPGARAAARRARLDLGDATPRTIADVATLPPLVITVCDQAHEELAAVAGGAWLHWSVADPVTGGTAAQFDATVAELRERIIALAAGAPT